MKRKTIVIGGLVLFLTVVSAFGAPGIIDAVTIATMDVEPGSTSPNTNLALYRLEKVMESGDDIQEDIEKYAYFLSYLDPTEEEIAYIDSLISKGYSAKGLVQIFEFWKDTIEDIEIIEKAYELKPANLDILYWVDSAFIELDKQGKTKSHYSDLSVEEVKEYYNRGIGYDEMLMADKLSRRGTKDIGAILEQKANDKSWYEIMDGVYSLSSDNNRKTDIEKYKGIINPNEILKSMKLAEDENKPVGEILDNVLSGESSALKCHKQAADKHTRVREEFIKEGLWSEEKEKSADERKGGAF